MNIFNTQSNIFKVNGGIADEIANRPLATSSFYIFWATDTGEIFYDNGSWIQFGGGGGGFYFAVTLAQLVANIAANLLVPGAVYFITDRNYFFTATTNETISISGSRLQSVPFTYLDYAAHNGATWYGIFYLNVPASINDRCIWGAKVWINLTGTANLSPVDDFTLNPAEWVISTDANDYTFLPFAIQYDLQNDWINRQTDTFNNCVGISFVTAQDYGLSNNPVNVTDWNLYSAYASLTSFGNNICNFGFYNNRSFLRRNYTGRQISNNSQNNLIGYSTIQDNVCLQDGGIVNNKVNSIIFNNGLYISDNIGNVIYFNHIKTISNNQIANGIGYNTGTQNNITNNITATIESNRNSDIDSNICDYIVYNTIGGIIGLNSVIGIFNNSVTGDIYNNNFIGNIDNNTNNGSINENSGSITNINLNNNNGSILNNTITGAITKNSNAGNIQNNQSNVTLIEHNSNTGNINVNNNNGAIQHNNNNGNIANNTCLAITNNYCGGNLSNNSNIGNISSNNIGGAITGNSNTGAIFQNSNTASIQNNSNNGQIYRNANNGQILGITAPTTQIFSNVNNGDILTSTAGNITDPIVNK